MAEVVMGILSVFALIAPIILLFWLVTTLNQMSRDLARVAEGVHYLAERASRQDSVQP